MQKILILGCCGAGKSTFARKLNEKIGIEIIHLDQHYWNTNWQETERSEWEIRVQELANRPTWIMDGNYGSTLDMRIEKADTIIYLDVPTYRCLWRITKRTWQYYGTPRPDMPAGCNERFDFEFFHYVAVFNLVRRPSLMRKLESLDATKQVEILKGEKAIAQFLEEV